MEVTETLANVGELRHSKLYTQQSLGKSTERQVLAVSYLGDAQSLLSSGGVSLCYIRLLKEKARSTQTYR